MNDKYITSIALMFLIMLSNSCSLKHPKPYYEKLSIVSSPVAGKATVQIIATQWTDGRYPERPCVKFKDTDNNTWIVWCYGNEPNECKIYFVPFDGTDSKYKKLNFERLAYPYQNVFVIPSEKDITIPEAPYNPRFLPFDRLLEDFVNRDSGSGNRSETGLSERGQEPNPAQISLDTD
jgi:hypothetical protein